MPRGFQIACAMLLVALALVGRPASAAVVFGQSPGSGTILSDQGWGYYSFARFELTSPTTLAKLALLGTVRPTDLNPANAFKHFAVDIWSATPDGLDAAARLTPTYRLLPTIDLSPLGYYRQTLTLPNLAFDTGRYFVRLWGEYDGPSGGPNGNWDEFQWIASQDTGAYGFRRHWQSTSDVLPVSGFAFTLSDTTPDVPAPPMAVLLLAGLLAARLRVD